MTASDGNGLSEPGGIEQIKTLIRLNRGSTDEQISALREELQSALKAIERFEYNTEGAVDAGLRLASLAENEVAEVRELVENLKRDIARQQLYSLGLNAQSLLHNWAVTTIDLYGLEDFRKLHSIRYLNDITKVQGLLTLCSSGEFKDLRNIPDQLIGILERAKFSYPEGGTSGNNALI